MASPPLPRLLARMLRHEVGDLLQSIYTTVAILLERLPAELTLERRLLTDLKSRSETCRLELDAAVELVSPGQSAPGSVDLAALTGVILTPLRRRFPTLTIDLTTRGQVTVLADSRAVSLALSLCTLAACQNARSRVGVTVAGDAGLLEWIIEHDGQAPTAEQMGWLKEPFSSTRQPLYGMALAVSRQTIEAHGGRSEILPRADGGARLCLVFNL